MARRATVEFVLRPFEGLPGEPDWVAMREVVPAATATARTTKEHGARDVTVTTVLPMAWPALHRGDGTIMLALQQHAGSGDASRDLADLLLRALELKPGTPITSAPLPEPGPRLQDVLDLSVPFEVTVHEGFDYWTSADAELTPDVVASLERMNETIVPTTRLTSVDAAYWARMGDREYLRWAMPHDEQAFPRRARAPARAAPLGPRRGRLGRQVHRRVPLVRDPRAGLGPRAGHGARRPRGPRRRAGRAAHRGARGDRAARRERAAGPRGARRAPAHAPLTRPARAPGGVRTDRPTGEMTRR